MSNQINNQNGPRVEFRVYFQAGYLGRKHLRKGVPSKEPQRPIDDLPRLTRLLALAHRWSGLIDEGVVSDYAEIAKMMGLSRARVTQIMDLLYLAPDIQDDILFARSSEKLELDVPDRAMRQITRIPDWNDQRKLWRSLHVPLIRRGE